MSKTVDEFWANLQSICTEADAAASPRDDKVSRKLYRDACSKLSHAEDVIASLEDRIAGLEFTVDVQNSIIEQYQKAAETPDGESDVYPRGYYQLTSHIANLEEKLDVSEQALANSEDELKDLQARHRRVLEELIYVRREWMGAEAQLEQAYHTLQALKPR